VIEICDFDGIKGDLIAAKAISRSDESEELAFWQIKEGKYRLDLGDQRESIDFGKGKSGWKRVFLAACWRENKVKVCDFALDICISVEIKETARNIKGEVQVSPSVVQTNELFSTSACLPYAELKEFLHEHFPFPPNSECQDSYPVRLSRLQPCHSSCFTCSDSTSTGCLSCFPGFAVLGNSCLPCDPTCQTCQLPTNPTSCLTCIGTATATSPPAACICPSSSYLISSPYQCNPCAGLCSACIGTATTCTDCTLNASLSGGVCTCDLFYFAEWTVCSSCQSSCKSCLNALECVDCVVPALWFFFDKRCYCKENYYTLTTPRSCLPCHSTCFSCFDGLITDCKSCWMNAELLNGGPRAACRCISAFFPDPNAQFCNPCYASCLSCSDSSPSNCLICIPNATFTSGNCICNQGFFLVQVPAACTNCNPTCKECQGSSGNECVSCSSVYASLIGNSGHGYCQCNQGFFPNLTAATCTACHISCLACIGSDASKCTKCHTKAFLSGISPNICSCLDGFYPNSDPNNCQPCEFTCLTCSGPLSSECLSCSPPFTLSAGICTCPPSSTPPNCINCHITCLSCSGVGAAQCTGCKANAILQTATLSNCICVSGYMPDSGSGNCLSCDISCLSCYSIAEVDCYECYSNASLVGGNAPSKCACNSGYFPNLDIAHCSACHISCFVCTGSGDTECSLCYPNAVKTGGKCDCSSMYFPAPNVANCQPCHYTCLTCIGTSRIDCTSCFSFATSEPACICIPHYYPNPASNNCSICNEDCNTCDSGSSDHCLSCYSRAGMPIGSLRSQCSCLLHHYTLSDAAHCLPCDPSCYSCWNGGVPDCLFCYKNASLTNGTRSACACDLRYFPNTHAGLCNNCHYSCFKCTDASDSNCTLCDPNAIFSAGTCTCITGYYMTFNGPNCYLCDISCKSCSNANSCNTCYSNATPTASGGTNYCKCVLGYYPETNAVNCQLCHPTCKGCTGPLSTNCSQCKGTATLQTSPGPSPCFCANDYNLNPMTGLCEYCALTCFTCTGPSSGACTVCWPWARLVPEGGPGVCDCEIGRFPAPTSRTCAPCDRTCRKCYNNTPIACYDCYDFAELIGTACICTARAYPDPDSSSCRLCSLTCSTCSGPYSHSCTGCNYAGYLQGPAPNLCLCSPGFYPDPDASQCSACLAVCATCPDAVTCSSCRANAELGQDFLCLCIPGSMSLPDASNCIICPKGCKSCFDIGCLECIAGYYMLQFACYEHCPHGYEAALHSYCAVADMSPPVPALTVLGNNALSMSFDKYMNFTLSSTDFSIDVITPSGDLSPVTWSEPEFQTSSNFTVYLTFQASYLPPYSEANFTFLSPSQVLSAQLVPTTTLWLIATLHSFGTQPANHTTTLRDSTITRNTAAAVQGVVAVTVVNSMVSGSSGSLVSLINQLQLITYLSMTKLPLKTDFAGTLAAMNVGNMLPNPLSEYISMKITVEKAISPPEYVANYGIETVLFLTNACSFLIVAGLMLFSYIPTHIFTKSSNSTVAAYCRNRMKSLTFATPLRTYLTSYLDMCLFSLLQVSQMRESLISAYAWISLLLACLFLLVTWATPIALVAFTVANRAKMMRRTDVRFNERWGVLYQNFVQSDKAAILAFYSLFVTRRLLLVGTLVLLPDYIAVFAVLNSSVSVLSVLYVVLARPYQALFDQVEGVTIEAGTAVVYFLASAYALPLSSAVQTVLDAVGTWAVRAVVGLNFLFSLCRTVMAVLQVVRLYRARMNQVKYALHDSRNSVNTRDVYEVPNSMERRGRLWWK